jgi:hypothetical protein
LSTGDAAVVKPPSDMVEWTVNVCGIYPFKLKLTVKSSPEPISMVQGVRHVFPSEVRASAPGGVDWINISVVVGFGLKALKPGMATELQDASPTLKITTARVR